jgi:hypothetical protein
MADPPMKTLTSSVGFQDEFGNLLTNGSLILGLPLGAVYKIISGGGQVVSQSFIVNLNAVGKVPAGVQIWASDELNGSPLYSATLCRNADGVGPAGAVNWLISGTSPIDLSLLPRQS